MSVFLPPDEGPFVFGAYAAHLSKLTDEPVEADEVMADVEADLAEPAPKLAS
ncbi:MAG: hypothetical protein ABWY56_03460 [Propionibacteriaceae bacterium]